MLGTAEQHVFTVGNVSRVDVFQLSGFISSAYELCAAS